MGSLERVLEQDVARQRDQARDKGFLGRFPSKDDAIQAGSKDGQEAPTLEDEKTLEVTPLAVQDAAYEDDADDDLVDLGFKFGRMRVTERFGGFFRPKMAEELTIALNDWQQTHMSPEERAAEARSPQNIALSPNDSFMKPGPTFLAPLAGFFFGVSEHGRSLMDFLPSRLAADKVLHQYRRAVHPIAMVVFWPSLQIGYDNFWTNVEMGIEPATSLQALVFAILFSGAVSMQEDVCISTFGVPNKALVVKFQQATEMFLSKANFLRTTRVETLQALVIYIIPMCRGELSRAHSALFSAAMRLAECMGLHRDPTLYGLSPVDVHVRRLLWYQLCVLDFRTCEAYGPRPLIRSDEYDTAFPLNVNEVDLVAVDDPKERDYWTDMTFMRIRFECNEMNRMIWIDRIRLERKEISLTNLLGKIEKFRKELEKRYMPMLDGSDPLHRWTRCFMSLMLSRMHIMVLHRYHYSMAGDCPERLRSLLISSAVQSLEDAIELETNPDLAPWSWFSGAFQQYHIAVLLLVEIFSWPMRQEADRIWKCLDYVFDADPRQSRQRKGRKLLSELRDKFSIYRTLRKMRTPVTLAKQLKGEAKGPGAYHAEGRDKSGSPTSLPLSLSTQDWRPVRPRAAPIMDSGTDQSMATRAASSDWGFPAPSILYPVRRSNDSPISGPPGGTAENSPPVSSQDIQTSQPTLAPSNEVYLNQQIFAPSDKFPLTQNPYNSSNYQNPDQNMMGMLDDIDWREWDQLFPQNVTNSQNVPTALQQNPGTTYRESSS